MAMLCLLNDECKFKCMHRMSRNESVCVCVICLFWIDVVISKYGLYEDCSYSCTLAHINHHTSKCDDHHWWHYNNVIIYGRVVRLNVGTCLMAPSSTGHIYIALDHLELSSQPSRTKSIIVTVLFVHFVCTLQHCPRHMYMQAEMKMYRMS